MKKTLIALFAVLALNACTDPKAQEKTLLEDVIKLHDKVMGKDEQLMQKKMILDTLFIIAKNDDAKAEIKYLSSNLQKADSAMENWMQKFDASQKGKTHEQIINYLTDQKKQIQAVDTQLEGALNESIKYLKILGK